MTDYQTFISQINRKLGIDLSLYKEAQMKRRLTSLRNKRGFNDFASYFHALDRDKKLLNEFTDRITINVSEFFRNPKRWDILRDKIIPSLLESRAHLNIWSAACSTGEEPYSVIMMLKEYFPQVSFKLIATDIDENILQKAQNGLYKEQALKEVPDNMKRKYFTYHNNLYKISEHIKKEVSFLKHDLLKDPYPTEIDLIICRNVLIYFTDEAKENIYYRIGKTLTNKGILFVGSTEQIFHPERFNLRLFDTFFYQKI
ncbi:chemotaxis protein methyltransferase CheR [Cerasibacillus quisquiliarum]|uniref:protein-glutamate O-methyltransferase n=1 Tax=Cerasibacillus quisquiliarum TaxID=227865 RepID=A0A511UYU4_9BACI|nr:protein-glutamate O-methyltransferase CheR [Cerasibacillus quisquiliarum]MBB5145374.1 chemotaxis protein methyltransferase CheR [Cerasibacillus quisquiliarum]GEN31810.1 chemotaxis protein methyltransferase [Cerasibacillus quisquiliarum]